MTLRGGLTTRWLWPDFGGRLADAKSHLAAAQEILTMPALLRRASSDATDEGQERARGLLVKALDLWEPMGARPYAERCRQKLAELTLSR